MEKLLKYVEGGVEKLVTKEEFLEIMKKKRAYEKRKKVIQSTELGKEMRKRGL